MSKKKPDATDPGNFLTPITSGFGAGIIKAARERNEQRFGIGVISQVEVIQNQIHNNKNLIVACNFAVAWYEKQLAAIEKDAFSLSTSGRLIFNDQTLNYNNPDDAMHERGRFGSLG